MPATRFRRTCLRACLLWLLAGTVLPFAPPAEAAVPVRILLHEQTHQEGWGFTAVLARLWEARTTPTDEALAVRAMPGAAARLRALARGRADFAIVDAAAAADTLSRYPTLAVVAVLWPEPLQAVTRNPRIARLELPLQSELWVLGDAGYAYRMLEELTRDSPPQQALISRPPEAILPDALQYGREPVLLISAPAPLPALSEAMGRDPRLHVLPFSSALLDEFKLNYPWLMTDNLDKGLYPGLSATLEVPALYQLLVGSRALPDATVNKMLATLYDKQAAAALFNRRFAALSSRMNAVFSKVFPFHPATAKAYGFTPSVP